MGQSLLSFEGFNVNWVCNASGRRSLMHLKA